MKSKNELLCPVFFCSLFGLVLVMKKAEVLMRDLSIDEKEMFKGITEDFGISGYGLYGNFGILHGKLVCLDYAD